MLPQNKQLSIWEFIPQPSPDGSEKEKSKQSRRQRVTDDTTSTPILGQHQPLSQLEIPELFSMLVSPPIARKMTSPDKLRLLLNDTQTVRSSQKLEADSILGGESSSPFWNELSQVMSQCLSSLTKIDSSDLALTISSGSVKSLDANSWFCTNKSTVRTQNSCRICCQSSTAFPVVYTDSANTKKSSGKTRSYKSRTRHSHRKNTEKLPANSALKVRIYPEPTLHEVWQSWKAAIRFIYNLAVEALKGGFNGGGYELEALVLNNPVLPEWVKDAPRHPKANAVQDAFDAWKQARANGGQASFRSCREPVHTIKFKAGGYRNSTWYPNLTKGLGFKASQSLPTDCEYGTQLVYDRRRWFAIIPQHVRTEPTQQSDVIALDPGVRTFLTGYDGASVLEFGRGDIGRIARLCFHLDKLMGKADGTDIRTKERRSYRCAAERIRVKIRNLVDDAHKKIASYLVKNYKVIFLPTFETSQMVKRASRRIHKKTARQMLTWSHYRFKQTLKSMAALRNVLVVDTNEAYTSKTCTFCGHVHRKLGSFKVFKCPECGSVHDRDWNGARNILLRALSGATFTVTGDAIEIFNHACFT